MRTEDKNRKEPLRPFGGLLRTRRDYGMVEASKALLAVVKTILKR